MLADKLYLRLLGLFATIIVLSQMGMIGYWLSPRQPEPKRSAAPFKFRHVSSPTFKYSFRVPDGDDAKWVEVEVPEKTGRKMLALLRGSRNWSTESAEYFRQHPETKRPWGRHFYPEFMGRLEVYEDGSEMPTLCITFLQSSIFDASMLSGKSETFLVLPQNRAEFGAAVAEAITGPNVIGD
jgi:hypothetical protein